MLIDLSIEKPERNFQRGYAHIGVDGTHFEQLPVQLMLDELDYSLCFEGVNEPDKFLSLLYQIICHQSYHIEVDEKAKTTYWGINQMFERGANNPRIEKLENVLNALDLSLAICRVQDRDNDVLYSELPRACFFQHLITKARWNFKETILLLWRFGLQFRLFTVAEAQINNTLEHIHSFDLTELGKRDCEALLKSVEYVSLLLQVFNVRCASQLSIEPPAKPSQE